MCICKECQLLRCNKQAKQLEMSVTLLVDFENEQLLFVMLDFKPYMGYYD